MGYVYFISDGQGHVKIGKANDPLSRLKELQCGNAYKLKIIDLIYVVVKRPSWVKTSHVEHSIHTLFSKHRIHDEWFSEEPVLDWLKQIRENKVEYPTNLLEFGLTCEEWMHVYKIEANMDGNLTLSYFRKYKQGRG